MKSLLCLASILLLGGLLQACVAPVQPSPTTTTAPLPTSTPAPSPTSSPAAPPTPTPFTVKGTIRPGDKIGEMTITNEESKHYYWIYDSCNINRALLEPFSQTVECTVPKLAQVGVGEFWGAVADKFDSSWEPMTWELYIDDYQIALDEFGWSDFSYFDAAAEQDVTFRGWNVLLRNLTAGRHTIRSSWTLATAVDDGWDIYPAGKYEIIANLTVTEKPVYPGLPQAAEAGQHAYRSRDGGPDFLLYVPKSYGDDPGKKWPLLVYLHDAELRGLTPDFLRKDALPRRMEGLKEFPFLVVSPAGNGDWDFWSKDEMIVPVMKILDEIQSIYSVDAKRIYLTGAGMGGNGVWAMGLLHSGYFAALAPLDGYFYPFEVPENICDLKKVPVWAFHGGNDFMVPAEVEEKLVNALKACGGNARITVKPDAVIPLDEYYSSRLFDWLLEQSKE